MTVYNTVTPAVVEELRKIVGSKHVLVDDIEKMEAYSHDEVAEKQYSRMPEVVVSPISAEEISLIVKLANREHIPVTPQGARSGLSGGGVVAYGGILLSVERMDHILEIDHENMMAVVEPGVITNDFSSAVQKEGLFFAGYPMSLLTCFIGGNVAENAGGGKAIKYGATGRYVLGLEVVLPSGEIAFFGGKRVKDVTGYNMVQLMVGSEGTLGIFTKIILKLIPLPKAKIDMMVLFADLHSAINVVPKIMTEVGITPTGIEFMDRLTLETSCDYLGESLKHYKDAGAFLIIEVDGNDPEQLLNQCLEISDFCLEHDALDAFIAQTPSDQEKIWKLRRNAAEAFKAISPHQSLEDIVVPISAIPAVPQLLKELSEKYDLFIPCYGHAGDGNLHPTIVKNPEHTEEYWLEILPKVLTDLYTAISKLGGTISGEHGIGSKRKQYLPLVLGKTEIEAMKSIKRALDPNNIMNPGKIFDL
ncbi:MAG TPA: FAD-linked oxidase C-terminal domain-containing protein [Candidatus Limnocylindrales bacterium]|nr:FAD-linked oxidase C-terminal domain-containing protein [Candidatus Limnocylindrales bacterium]